jgi:hypothetical protein
MLWSTNQCPGSAVPAAQRGAAGGTSRPLICDLRGAADGGGGPNWWTCAALTTSWTLAWRPSTLAEPRTCLLPWRTSASPSTSKGLGRWPYGEESGSIQVGPTMWGPVGPTTSGPLMCTRHRCWWTSIFLLQRKGKAGLSEEKKRK